MLLDVGADSCLTSVSSCYSGVSRVEAQTRREKDSSGVNVGKSTTVECPALLGLTTTSDLATSCPSELPDEQTKQQEKFRSETFPPERGHKLFCSGGMDNTSVGIQEEELALIKGAVEKVLCGDDNVSEGNDEAMDTDSTDYLQLPSSDSLSDVTPENENLAFVTTDCVFVCPNFDRTVIILDWDDTLLSSSWLASEGLKVDEQQELPEAVRYELNELESLVLSLLMECSKHGIVSIVTNAETGWVELSSKKFIPRVSSYIEEGIRVVSARSNFEKEYPDSPAQWKEKAFLLELSRLPVDLTRLNLLVLGDSWNERDAGHVAGNVYVGSHVKSVKFIERPTVEQLKRQLSLIISSLHHLCDHEGSFDVNMRVSLTENLAGNWILESITDHRVLLHMDLHSFILDEDVNYDTQLKVESENFDTLDNSQTNKWILEKHNMWTKITLNSFYEECARGTVTSAQLTKWVYDRYRIAQSQASVCEVFESIFGKQASTFCAVIREDLGWFENKWHQLVRLSNSQLQEYQPTYGAQELIDYSARALARDSKPYNCLLLCWLVNFTFYQGWRMTQRHYQCNQTEILEIARWSCREELMVAIIDIQKLLDKMLRESESESLLVELALYFDGILARLDDMFEEIYLAKRLPGMKEYCSKCGRQGHSQERCAFKGHI